jgi:hypothetical protein
MASMNLSSMTDAELEQLIVKAQSEQNRRRSYVIAEKFRKRYGMFWACNQILIRSKYQERYPGTKPICPKVFEYQFKNLRIYPIGDDGKGWEVEVVLPRSKETLELTGHRSDTLEVRWDNKNADKSAVVGIGLNRHYKKQLEDLQNWIADGLELERPEDVHAFWFSVLYTLRKCNPIQPQLDVADLMTPLEELAFFPRLVRVGPSYDDDDDSDFE